MGYIGWIVVALVLGAFFLLAMLRQRYAGEQRVNVADFQAIYDALQRTGEDGAFAAFILNPEKPGAQNALNLQFSKEKGVVGFDWVLLADMNIRDEERVKDFAHAQGIELQSRTMNDVRYLRTESEKLVDLQSSLITEMYHCPSDIEIAMIQEGFKWDGNGS